MDLKIDIVNNGRYNVHVIEDDAFIGNVIRHGYEWDGFMRETVKNLYKPGTDLLDIGGNIGYNALMFSDYGPVHSYEPVFHSINKKNIEINKLKNDISVHPYALSDKNEKDVDFFIAKSVLYKNKPDKKYINYGGTSMFFNKDPIHGHNPNLAITAECKTLDSVYEGIPSVIKIDVEGAELNVLKGATETIKKHKPSILVEIHDYEKSEVGPYIENLGYKNETFENNENMYFFISCTDES